MPSHTEVEGIRVTAVTRWFEGHIPDARPPLAFELIAGGRSNLTYRVTDRAGQSYVLRRPPLSHVLPTAHDMAREHRIVSALGPTAVPVAPTLGYCGDPSVNDAPFYVMRYVEGHILRDAATAEKVFDPPQRRLAGEHLVDVLADLHQLDPDSVGLGELGRRDGYIDRQLKRWHGQFRQSAEVLGHEVPEVDQMHAFLAEHVPPQGPPAIVHGDYRLDNMIFDQAGQVLAVLDWELCTLGDPLADLGLLMVYWAEPGDQELALLVDPTTVAGFPTRQALRQQYEARSGRDLSRLDYYVAFGYWKLACILEGVVARYVAGAMAGESREVEGLSQQVSALSQAARRAAANL